MAKGHTWWGAALVVMLAGCGTSDERDGLLPPAPPSRAVAKATASPRPTATPTAAPRRSPRNVATKSQPEPTKAAPVPAKPTVPATRTPAATPTPAAPILPALGQGQDFQLTDQFDKAHTFRFPKDRPSVLAFGDKDGSNQIEGWIKPLVDRYTDRLDIQGVAELGMVPGFARGMVKGIMSALTTNPVMLDWDGTVSKAYGYAGGGQAGILILDDSGVIRWRTSGAVTATGIADAQRVLDQLLAD